MNIGFILLIVLVICLLGGFAGGFNHVGVNPMWGGGGLGLVLLIIILLIVFGRL